MGAFLLAEQHGSGGRDGAENRAGGASVAAAQTDPRWVCAGAETHTGAWSLVGGVVFLLRAVKPLRGCGGHRVGFMLQWGDVTQVEKPVLWPSQLPRGRRCHCSSREEVALRGPLGSAAAVCAAGCASHNTQGPYGSRTVRGLVCSLTRAAGQTTQMRGRVSKVSPGLDLVTRE